MMQTANPRAALTRRRLEKAFLELLEQKSIHQINIRELCALAGVNRTTFYNHYGSQYDLLEDMSSRFLQSVQMRLTASGSENVQERVELVLAYMQENLALSRLLLSRNEDAQFAGRLFSLPQISSLFQDALCGVEDAQMRTAIIEFAIHGSYRLLQNWILQEKRISPVLQTEQMLTLARRVCR